MNSMAICIKSLIHGGTWWSRHAIRMEFRMHHIFFERGCLALKGTNDQKNLPSHNSTVCYCICGPLRSIFYWLKFVNFHGNLFNFRRVWWLQLDSHFFGFARSISSARILCLACCHSGRALVRVGMAAVVETTSPRTSNILAWHDPS